jgi:hypothetical protein
MKRILLALVVLWSGRLFATELDRNNVVWDVPGKSSADSMPLGNGELGINLWVQQDGDLHFYLGRNDSHSEIGQLCKVGWVSVSLSPNPFVKGAPFRQELKIRDGVCEITAGQAASSVRLKVFVDAAQPVVHVVGESAAPVTVTARILSWRERPQKPTGRAGIMALGGSPEPVIQAADIFPSAPRRDAVAWYHRNENSPAFEATIKLQALEPIRNTLRDPFLHRTFGGWITVEGFEATDHRTLATPAPVKTFDLRVASPCAQTPSADAWLALAEAAAKGSSDAGAALARTKEYWHSMWSRSWVICDQSNAAPVPVNNQPLWVGPVASTQTTSQVAGVMIAGEVLAEAEIAAAAKRAPPTAEVPTTVPAMPEITSGLTLQGWVKWINGSPNIVEKCTPGKGDAFSLGIFRDGRVRFVIGQRAFWTPAAVKGGQWQHIAGTYDSKSAVMTVFIDGVRVAGMGSENMTVGRGYTLQRYQQLCASRGSYPVKFNGSIFTVDPSPMKVNDTPDYRCWGDGFWWQNTRHAIHSMLPSGDFDQMMPAFKFYEGFRAFYEARTKLFFGAQGCHFPETVTPFGTWQNGDYGWSREGRQPGEIASPYLRYSCNESMELLSLMFDYYDYTGDQQFLKERIVPMATSALTFFDTRFKKDAEGRIVLDPTQALECYQIGVVNDTPTVAGLIAVTTRLCALPESATSDQQRKFFQRMKAAAPLLPMETVKTGDKEIRFIRPAEKFAKRCNGENPELYPVWPYHMMGLGLPMLDEARATWNRRGVKWISPGWDSQCNLAALLGDTEVAKAHLLNRISNANGLYRWPATWGPNADWLPDANHGGGLMNVTHYMLLQSVGEKILLFPAWPKDWDVSFKLHAARQTIVQATLRGGKVTELIVTPDSRRKDVILEPSLH